jgi:cytochrome c oxidase assembly protein subunit 15
MIEKDRTPIIRNWLYFNAFMVFCMAIIGAITRLTESGLSMVEWRPLIGAIPPLTDAEWVRVFELYRQTPEYQKINTGMAMAEFKTIFFWEWFHRVWGRLIGLVYALPLLFFWVKGWIPKGYKLPLFGLLILGGMQAVIGYIMVLSGLADRPFVSHFKLALHLSMAWFVFCGLLWLAFSLTKIEPLQTSFCKRRHGWSSLALLFITLVWGAFMAGMDAGLVSPHWPHMYQGQILPDTAFTLSNIFANAEMVHFIHRWIAFITLIFIIAFAWRVKSFALGGMVALQFLLGIATVMSMVAIPIAAMHQGGAFILTVILLYNIYALKPRDVIPSQS